MLVFKRHWALDKNVTVWKMLAGCLYAGLKLGIDVRRQAHYVYPV